MLKWICEHISLRDDNNSALGKQTLSTTGATGILVKGV
jgi:hypothetical protein